MEIDYTSVGAKDKDLPRNHFLWSFFVEFDWQYFYVFVGGFRKRVISTELFQIQRKEIPINVKRRKLNNFSFHTGNESNSQSPSNILPN